MFNKFVRNLFIISSLFPIFFIRGIVSAFIFKESGWWLYFIISVIFFVIAFTIAEMSIRKLKSFFIRTEKISFSNKKSKSIILFCLILATSLLPSNILFFIGYCVIYLIFIYKNPLNPIYWVFKYHFYQIKIDEKNYFLVSRERIERLKDKDFSELLDVIKINNKLFYNPLLGTVIGGTVNRINE